MFRYHTNRHYYAFTIFGGRKARLALIRNSLYNNSNYRATVSLPGWKQ